MGQNTNDGEKTKGGRRGGQVTITYISRSPCCRGADEVAGEEDADDDDDDDDVDC